MLHCPLPRSATGKEFNLVLPAMRAFSDYFSLEDKVVFSCSGTYKKYPRSYGAHHRVCGGHCPTSGHSGPRTPVNDLPLDIISDIFCRHRIAKKLVCLRGHPGRSSGGSRVVAASANGIKNSEISPPQTANRASRDAFSERAVSQGAGRCHVLS